MSGPERVCETCSCGAEVETSGMAGMVKARLEGFREQHAPCRTPPVPLAAVREAVRAAADAGAILLVLLTADEDGARHAPEVRRAMELAEAAVREVLGRSEWDAFREGTDERA